jgi:hypothetical protein
MQAVHALEAHKAERDLRAARHLCGRELERLRDLALARVLDVLEPHTLAVHEDLDRLRRCPSLALSARREKAKRGRGAPCAACAAAVCRTSAFTRTVWLNYWQMPRVGDTRKCVKEDGTHGDGDEKLLVNVAEQVCAARVLCFAREDAFDGVRVGLVQAVQL